jgi:hypothetical protein
MGRVSGTTAVRDLFRRPPGLWFHAALVIPTAVLLWAHSLPRGPPFFVWAAAGLSLLALAGVWTLRAATYLWARRTGDAHGLRRWFVVAPLAAALYFGSLFADAPLRVRWALSRASFDRVVADLLDGRDDGSGGAREAADREGRLREGGRRIGSYEIFIIERVGDAVVFFEDHGAPISDLAGFAYIPGGPSAFPDLVLERPEFRALGDDWYAWTATF